MALESTKNHSTSRFKKQSKWPMQEKENFQLKDVKKILFDCFHIREKLATGVDTAIESSDDD